MRTPIHTHGKQLNFFCRIAADFFMGKNFGLEFFRVTKMLWVTWKVHPLGHLFELSYRQRKLVDSI